MQQRALGQTGEVLSVVGFGGIVVTRETPEDAAHYVGGAIDRGVNYFDVAPTYGNAEDRLGPALEPYRKDVFLACKTGKWDADAARESIEGSLRRLRTDHVDLLQLHGVSSVADAERILGAGGALEAFVAARERGLTRFLGFSAHSEVAGCALLDAFDFDTVMYPINYVTWLNGGFGPRLMAKAQEKGTGVLALKALAQTHWPEGGTRSWPKCWYKPVDTPEEARLALRFTLSKPVTAAVSPSHAELLWWMCDAADDLTPLSDDERAHLEESAASLEPIFSAEQT